MDTPQKRVPNSVFKLLIVLFAVIFAGLVGRSLWELGLIGAAVNPPRNARYRIEYRFAMLVPESDHDLFYRRSGKGMREILEKENAVLEIFRYPEGGRDEIRRMLRLILHTNPTGVVLSFPYDPSYSELLGSFHSKGIFLVTMEYDAVSQNVHIGTNPFELGRLAREAAERLSPHGSAAVLLTGGNAGFIQGFGQATPGGNSLEIAMIRFYEDSLAAGEEFIREILTSRNDISVAVFTGSRDAEGASLALIEYGRIGTPLIVASGDNPEILRLMDMGVISASVTRNPEAAGRAAAEALCALAKNERTNAYVDPGSSVLWEKSLAGGTQ